MIDEEQFFNFIAILNGGGELLMHPDTWKEMKRLRPSVPEVNELLDAASIRVSPSKFLEPGKMVAIKPHKFAWGTPNFQFAWSDVPIQEVRFPLAEEEPNEAT